MAVLVIAPAVPERPVGFEVVGVVKTIRLGELVRYSGKPQRIDYSIRSVTLSQTDLARIELM